MSCRDPSAAIARCQVDSRSDSVPSVIDERQRRTARARTHGDQQKDDVICRRNVMENILKRISLRIIVVSVDVSLCSIFLHTTIVANDG
jgi:hypothetical protein